jgi:hypothetical protein
MSGGNYRARRVGKLRKRLVHEYLVKRAGYSSEQNSWEPANNFTPDLLAAELEAVQARACSSRWL